VAKSDQAIEYFMNMSRRAICVVSLSPGQRLAEHNLRN
jgi:hypothetical protein